VWDTVLRESRHFRVVPSKGSFIPGWTLIVPKEHTLSIAQLGSEAAAELSEIVACVARLLEERYTTPTAFGHGAVCRGTSFGCGIDHAHLHLVPLPASICLRELAEVELGEKFQVAVPRSCRPYLWLREPRDREWLLLEPSAALPRQFFRQILWRALGRPGPSFDYDESPCLPQVEATVASLAAK
jgi:diadenosine tetraphosphate (Ap4A) HIT family hydrolase